MSLPFLFSRWKLARENELFSLSFKEYVLVYGSFQDIAAFNNLEKNIKALSE